jgi:DNA repair protein RadA/Sms
MVDVVLSLEGESLSSYRILRGIKNRFGSTNEIGLFHMGGRGMEEVSDPSQALLTERAAEAVGSAIVPVIEGSRPLLVEVQALNSQSVLPTPRRVTNGIEFNRLLMVVAVLARRAGLKLSNQDIIVNVVGGLRISEPAADLGIALAIASSTHNRPLPMDLAAIGEIGLSGELRTVPQLDRRLAECARLGLSRCIVPHISKGKLEEPSGIKLDFAPTVRQALATALARRSQQTLETAE